MSNFQLQKAYLVQKRQSFKSLNKDAQQNSEILGEQQRIAVLGKSQLNYFPKNKLQSFFKLDTNVLSLTQFNIQFNKQGQFLAFQQNKSFSAFQSRQPALEPNFNQTSNQVKLQERKSHSSLKKFQCKTSYKSNKNNHPKIQRNTNLQECFVYEEKRFIPYISIPESLSNMKSNSLYLTYRSKKPQKQKMFVINFWDLLAKRGFVTNTFFCSRESNPKKPYKFHKNLNQIIQDISQEYSIVILIDKDAYTKQMLPILQVLPIDAIYINYQNIHYFFDFNQILVNFKGVEIVTYMTSIMCELQDGFMSHTKSCLYNRLPFVKENIKFLIVLIPHSIFINKDPFDILSSLINNNFDRLNKDIKPIHNINILFEKDINCLFEQIKKKHILQIIHDLKEDYNIRQIKDISQTNAHLNIYNELKHIGQTKHPTFFSFIGELFIKNCKFPQNYDKVKIKLIDQLHAIDYNSNQIQFDYSSKIDYFKCIKNNIFTIHDL